MTRLLQVKEFNALVKRMGMNRAYVMTTGSGAMFEPERVKGWVTFQSPKLGDKQDFARWHPNKRTALNHLKALN